MAGVSIFDLMTKENILTALTSRKGQNFLGRRWIPFLFQITPKTYRRALALRLLAISPHYFIYQRSSYYPPSMSRLRILEAEYQRNKRSREIVCEDVLKPYLHPKMDVLDFGCGPGFLAREAAKYAHRVTGVDISRGVIACAQEFDNPHNVGYLINNGKDLSILQDEQFDLIYSFEVIQHLSEELFEKFLREFFRVLKPKGKCVCDIALGGNGESKPQMIDRSSLIAKHIEKSWRLPFVARSSEKVKRKIRDARFKELSIIPIQQISDCAGDDVVKRHLIVFNKP